MENRRVLNAEELLEKIFFLMNEMVPIRKEPPSGTGTEPRKSIGHW